MITKRRFLFLCRKCDQLLLSKNTSIYRISIPWLNLIRPHPSLLRNYSHIFDISNPISNFFFFLKKFIFAILKFIFSFIRSLLNKKTFDSAIHRKFYDVILVSHLVSSIQLEAKDDLYFGSMPSELKNAGFKALIVMIDQRTKKIFFKGDRYIRQNDKDFITLGWRMPLRYSLKNYVLFFKEFLSLFCQALFVKNMTEKKILFSAAIDCLNNGPGTLLIADQIASLVNTFKANFLITTYEGHTYEKLIFARSRDTNPDVFCMGYQHATLFYLQHGIKRQLGKEYAPDMVLASGVISKREFENFDSSWRTLLIGSKRAGNLSGDIKRNGRFKTCLVLPEVQESEVLKLFNYSLACAKNFKNIKFIWRLHPAFSLDRLQAIDARFSQLPSNITLSNKTLTEDAMVSDIALFRGSSSIIEAVTSGTIAVYLSNKKEISINPLYRDDTAYLSVSEISDFKDILELFYAKDESKIKLIKKKAVDHCLQIFTPMRVKPLVDFMKSSYANSIY